MTIEEHRVLDAVADATTQLAAAAERVARVYRSGGRVFFLGAGTGARLAVQEVAELPPTFGISPDRFAALVAAGPTAGPAAITHTEDDTEAAPSALRSHGCSPTDAVIGLAASGTTPFVLAGMTYANQLGAWTCGIANNPGTPLITEVNLGILLDTGPEVLTGSTRLKAGTAQKLALNRITTAALTRCGLVQSNMMTNVVASNDKLRTRSIRIVSTLAHVTEEQAVFALGEHDWHIPTTLDALHGAPP